MTTRRGRATASRPSATADRLRLVRLPADAPDRAAPVLEHAPVLANQLVAPEHYLITLEAPAIAARAQPGQFAMLTVAGPEETHPVLPRPMALYDYDAARGQVRVLYRVMGGGTRRLAEWQPPEVMTAVGPLGSSFQLPSEARAILLIGRGIGICSLTALAVETAARGIAVAALVSGRYPEVAIGLDLFARLRAKRWVVTDAEGTSPVELVGPRLERWLDKHPVDHIYTCGSERLLHLAARLGERHGAGVQVSLEAHMACGLGYCHGCSTGHPGLAEEAPLVCKDGPIFAVDGLGTSFVLDAPGRGEHDQAASRSAPAAPPGRGRRAAEVTATSLRTEALLEPASVRLHHTRAAAIATGRSTDAMAEAYEHPGKEPGGAIPAPDPRLAIHLGPLALQNPVMPASGCFGPELGDLIDLGRLGALVTKTVFYRPRSGNPAHRLAETASGMLNSVGIPSRGIEAFLDELLPRYLAWPVPTIISIGGLSIGEFWELADRLADVEGIAGLEINISCPNLEAGGLEIGANPRHVAQVVRGVVDHARVPVFAKLTPNVTSIAEIARAAEDGGATALVAINTLKALGLDPATRRPLLGTTTGGLSGPAIKTVALRMVWEVARAVSIPVVGVGGIASAADALEFFMAGATAVQVGTATFTRPDTMLEIVDGLSAWLAKQGVDEIAELIGTMQKGTVDVV